MTILASQWPPLLLFRPPPILPYQYTISTGPRRNSRPTHRMELLHKHERLRQHHYRPTNQGPVHPIHAQYHAERYWEVGKDGRCSWSCCTFLRFPYISLSDIRRAELSWYAELFDRTLYLLPRGLGSLSSQYFSRWLGFQLGLLIILKQKYDVEWRTRLPNAHRAGDFHRSRFRCVREWAHWAWLNLYDDFFLTSL